jgi:putative nucleotidyltransferase with HDIG domain
MNAERSPEQQPFGVEAILAKVSEVAAMPQVVYKIIELTGSTLTTAQAIEDAISLDPGFSSKVLILANSAFYALPRRVTSIREAATFMGYKTIRQLALTIGVFDMFVGKTDSGSLRRRMWWRHSVDAAVCAKAVAQMVPNIEADDAYSCGLLHDVGKSLLDRATSGHYAAVEQLTQDGRQTFDAEREVFGCTHAELGAAAAKKWSLPEPIVESIRCHHGEAAGDYAGVAAITALASEFAHSIVEGKKLVVAAEDCPPDGCIIVSEWAHRVLGFDEERLAKAFEMAKSSIAQRSVMSM